MNPYAADGAVIDLGERTSSEQTQERLPEARLVKAFNTIWFKHLAENARISADIAGRHAIFVAGDDQAAKRVVIGLIEEIGFGGVDTGSLIAGGRRQQPNMPLYNRVMTVAEGRRPLTVPAAERPRRRSHGHTGLRRSAGPVRAGSRSARLRRRLRRLLVGDLSCAGPACLA
jgi:hypothetical protein